MRTSIKLEAESETYVYALDRGTRLRRDRRNVPGSVQCQRAPHRPSAECPTKRQPMMMSCTRLISGKPEAARCSLALAAVTDEILTRADSESDLS